MISFDFFQLDGAISRLHDEMHRFNESADLSGEQYRNAFLDFALKCERWAKEARAIAKHIHEWNGDDYCSICGADGRA